MSKKQCKNIDTCRLNKVGGQAVLEGVMMKAGERTVTSCRKEDGTIVVTDDRFVSVRKEKKFLNLPIIRGFVNFIEMMKLSIKTLEISAEALDIEDEAEKAKKEKRAAEGKSTVGTVDIVMILGVVLGLGLAMALFFFLPTFIAGGIEWICVNLFNMLSFGEVTMAIIDGVVKIAIFLAYIALVGLMPDIRRTFMYHGAEHKSIACFEAGEELTPANAMKHKRFHPRCGTSFMFLMIAIGIFFGMLVRFILPAKVLFPSDGIYNLTVASIKILLLPLTMGVGYEILMLAGKHDNLLTRIISAPGLWVQRLTTKEPTEDMLEVAITSIKCALRDEFPEYREFYENEEWKTEEEKAKEAAKNAEESADESVPTEADESTEVDITEADGAVIAAEGEAHDLPEVAVEESRNAADASVGENDTNCDAAPDGEGDATDADDDA